jgi:hypothetical protein
VGKENGVGVEKPGSVHPVRNESNSIATIK